MKKADLVTAVSEKTGMTKKASEITVAAIIGIITEAITSGERVRILGFGTFEVKDRAARLGRNPKTLEQVVIPPTKAIVFKSSDSLKERMLS